MSTNSPDSKDNWEISTAARTSALAKSSLEPVRYAPPTVTNSDQSFSPFFGENPDLSAGEEFANQSDYRSPTELQLSIATTKNRLLASLGGEIPASMSAIINPANDPVILGKGASCAILLERKSGRCFKFLRPDVSSANNIPHNMYERLAREYYFLGEALKGIEGLPQVYEAYSEAENNLAIATHYPSSTGNKPDRLIGFRLEYLDNYQELESLHWDLSGQTKIRIIIAALNILEEIHARRVLHRDLSTRNTMVKIGDEQKPWQLKTAIIDFGLAHDLDNQKLTSLTLPNRFVGHPAYAPPEQCFNHKSEYSTALDLYAVGIMLFKVFANEFPFHASDPRSLMLKHINTPPPSLLNFFHQKNHPCAQKLTTIVAKCLRKNPRERYQSATALRLELEDLLSKWSEFH